MTTPKIPPNPEPADTDGCTYAAYTDDQMNQRYLQGWRDAMVSTAREYQPEEDGAPGLGSVPAAGNLLIAIEEALASLESGMVQGAADTLRAALRAIPMPKHE